MCAGLLNVCGKENYAMSQDNSTSHRNRSRRREKLARDVAAADLSNWIGLGADEIDRLFEHLAESKLVERVAADSARFRLTDAGAKEDGRRIRRPDQARPLRMRRFELRMQTHWQSRRLRPSALR